MTRDYRAESRALPWDNVGNEAGAWGDLLRAVLVYKKKGAKLLWILAATAWMYLHHEEAGRGK